MNTNLIRTIIALFLIAHGLVHVSLTYVPLPKPGEIRTPFLPSWWRSATDPSWLASKIGLSNGIVRGIGCALWVLTLIGFTLAGLGSFGVPVINQLWIASAILGSVASLLLLAFYWHPWLIMGPAIDLAILAGIALHLPKFLFV